MERAEYKSRGRGGWVYTSNTPAAAAAAASMCSRVAASHGWTSDRDRQSANNDVRSLESLRPRASGEPACLASVTVILHQNTHAKGVTPETSGFQRYIRVSQKRRDNSSRTNRLMREGSKHVQPAAASFPPPTALQRLVDVCRSVFNGSHAPPTADIVTSICGMIDKIKPDDVGLMDDFHFSDEMNGAGCQNPPIITCKIIHDCDTFTITVFFLPRAAAMPLHNHPGMTVFSKLLVGSGHVVSYDWVHPRVCAAGPEPGTMTTTMLAERVLDDRFTTASGAWALFPDAGGNLHRLVAGEDGPCALLDVITPPYSPASETHAQQRFSYYQEFPYELHHPSHGMDDVELREEQKRRLAWLQEIGDEPKDLRISNLPYRGPPIA